MSSPEPGRSPPPPDGLPTQIGGYEIERVLGTGGMATVYAARQQRPRRTVALKVMRGTTDASVALRRFKREIEILGRLRHPYIAQVFDAAVHDDAGGAVPFFVMEYVPGARTIIEYVEALRLDRRRIVRLFVKVCAAVDHGHRHRIVHRDLKPGNILIDEAGDPRIIDFGVARAVEVDATSQTMHTEAGRLIGTIRYMAPEQLDTTRLDIDARCDVYALGVLLYRMLTGRAPHDLSGLPLFTAAQVIREDEPPRPSSIRPELKGDLETIVLRALAKDREHRYRSAGSLGRDLVRYLGSKPITARTGGPLYRLGLLRRRHPVATRAAAIVTVIVVLAAAVIVVQQIALRRQPPAAAPAADVSDAAQAAQAATEEMEEPAVVVAAAPPSTAKPVDAPAPPRLGFTLAGGHAGPVTALAFAPTGGHLASASEEDGVLWWDLHRRKIALRATDHDVAVERLAFSRDGTRLASADAGGEVVLIAREGARTRLLMRTRLPAILALAVAPAGDLVALAGPDLRLHLVADDGAEVLSLGGTRGAFRSIAFSDDGRRLAAGTDAGAVYVWSLPDGARVARPGVGVEPVIGVAFVPSDGRLVAVDAGGTRRAWMPADDAGFVEAADGASGPVEEGVRLLVAGPGGRWGLASSLGTPGVVPLDLSTGRRLASVLPGDAEPAPGGLAIAPDGRWCAVTDIEGSIRVEPLPAR